MTIDTLVQDIYGTMAVEDAAKERGEVLRMSSLGEKCTRKLWYRQHKPDTAEPLRGNTLLNFINGNKIEEEVLALVERSGHKVVGRQDEVTLEGVKGHIDCIIDGVLVDVKSANSRSMEKFEKHRLETDDPFGYLTQLGAYHASLINDPRLENKTQAAFLAVDKELGHLILDKYEIKPRPWDKLIASLKDLLAQAAPPRRAYSPEPDGKSGNMEIPMPCRYCQFKNECYKDSNNGRGLRKFLYSKGPRWLTTVIREPKDGLEDKN